MIATARGDPLCVPALDEGLQAGCAARYAVEPHATDSRPPCEIRRGSIHGNGQQGGKWKSTPSHTRHNAGANIWLREQPWAPGMRHGDGHGVVQISTACVGMTRAVCGHAFSREKDAQSVAREASLLNDCGPLAHTKSLAGSASMPGPPNLRRGGPRRHHLAGARPPTTSSPPLPSKCSD